MAVLISKPGINSTTAGGNAVPAAWSQSWFRGFISDYLKGADVRNAVGANGITVSGNITSPYATIGIGSGSTITGPLTVNVASGAAVPLTVSSSGTGANGTLVVKAPDGTNAIWVQDTGNTAGVSIEMSYNGTANLAGWMGFGPGGLGPGAAITDFGLYGVGLLKFYANTGHLVLALGGGAALVESTQQNGNQASFQADSSQATGAAFFDNNSTLGRVALTINSTGTDFGHIYNSAAQQWSLGWGATAFTGANPCLTWAQSGGAVALGFFGTGPINRITGYGTPTGGSHQGSFAAGTITLPNLAAAVAQLIVDLKSYGLVAA